MSITAFRAVSIGLLAGLGAFLALGPGAGHASLIIGALLAFIAEAIADLLRKRLLQGGAGSTVGA